MACTLPNTLLVVYEHVMHYYNDVQWAALSLVHSWLYMNMSCYNDVQWPAYSTLPSTLLVSLCLVIGLSES